MFLYVALGFSCKGFIRNTRKVYKHTRKNIKKNKTKASSPRAQPSKMLIVLFLLFSLFVDYLFMFSYAF